MPASRYQVRNEYSLADPQLYGIADRDDSEALLEGVAMAGLVGVLRQLGDLSEFAAEIFHDLHEEVMATAARGHGLMIRVQQLEADFFSIEKAILSQTNHSRFTYNAGSKWHANLRLDQNVITQGDMPRFVMGAYEECRGPPRLFLLDKFDIAGAGACLKRYSDPSIFKTEVASSGVNSIEVKKEKKVHKVKKKGTRWWNEEPPEIFRASDFNAKLRMASDENISEKTPIHGVKLKRRPLNSSSINSRNGKSYMEHILEMHLPKSSVPEPHEIGMDASMKRLLYKEKNLVQSPNSNRKDIPEAPMVELSNNILNSGYIEDKSIPLAEYEIEEISSTLKQVQKDVIIDGEGKIEVNDDGYRHNESELEKISSIFQFVDQKDASVDRGHLTESGADEYNSEVAPSELNISLESEVETETNIQVKHEPGFRVGSCMGCEHQELYAQCTDSYSFKNSSVASHDWSSSLENQESDHSDLDNISSSADLHASWGNEIASLGMSENFQEPSPSEQAVLGLPHNDLCLESADKSESFSDGQVAPYPYLSKIHSISSENFSSDGNLVGSKSLETYQPNDSGNDVPQAPGGPDHIPELDESPSTCITGPTSTCDHSSLDASLSGVQLDGLDTAEFLLGPLEFNGKPSCPEEVGKQVVDDVPCPAGISSFPSETNESAQSTKLAEICPNSSSNSVLQSSDIFHWSHGMKDDRDVMQKVLPTENVEDCSAAETVRIKMLNHIYDDLPVTDTGDLSFGTNADAILKRAPVEYIEEGSGVENALRWELDSSHLMKEEPVILTKQDQDACSGETPRQTYLINAQSSRYFLVIENGFPPSENLEHLSSAIDVQEVDSFQGESDKRLASSVLLEFPHSHDVELLESHVEDLRGISSEYSGKEGPESLSNASDNEVNDEPVVEGNHLNNVMKNSSLHVDLPLMPMVPNYTLKALPVEATPSDIGAGCILVENNLDGQVPDPSGSQGMSGDHIEVQDACFSIKIASDICGQQSSKSSMQENFVGSENDLNPPIVATTSLDLVPCMPDSNASGFLDCVHCLVQNHFHPTNDNSQAFMTSTESNRESELMSPHHNKTEVAGPTSFPLSPTVTSEQGTATASEKAPEWHDYLSMISENKVERTPECSDLRFEAAPYLEQIGSPHDLKEGISSPCNHEFYSFKLPKCSPDLSTSAALTPIFPAISLPMINQGFFEQQPYQAFLGSPMTGTNALEVNLEEMPPPPPLPPLEWRTGKLQCGSLFLGREMMHFQSSFPQVSTTESHNAQLGFSVAQASPKSLKSALVPTTTEDGASRHILQTSFSEIPHHSKSLELEDGNPQGPQHGFFTFGKEMTPPRCSSAPLLTVHEDEKNDKPQDSSHPASLDEESQHTLQTLVSEKPQPSKLFIPLPIVKVEKPQYGFVISGDKMVSPQSSSMLLPSEEEAEKDNMLHDASLTTKGEMSQFLDLYATPPVKEVPNKLQNGLLMSDGQGIHRPTAVSNLHIVEDEKPNGVIQAKLTQQKDPLVEAVAFHNRTLLRRVSERVRPEVKLMADERSSFLEQIRSKSFNLRPAAVKKPALEGPKTNLNVVAILEKANSIRQAFVGSDEDDDDGWSDS